MRRRTYLQKDDHNNTITHRCSYYHLANGLLLWGNFHKALIFETFAVKSGVAAIRIDSMAYLNILNTLRGMSWSRAHQGHASVPNLGANCVKPFMKMNISNMYSVLVKIHLKKQPIINIIILLLLYFYNIVLIYIELHTYTHSCHRLQSIVRGMSNNLSLLLTMANGIIL